MKKRPWFTIDIGKMLRDAGYTEEAKQFRTITFYEVERAHQTPALIWPQLSAVFVDESGRLRIDGGSHEA